MNYLMNWMLMLFSNELLGLEVELGVEDGVLDGVVLGVELGVELDRPDLREAVLAVVALVHVVVVAHLALHALDRRVGRPSRQPPALRRAQPRPGPAPSAGPWRLFP